MKTLPEQGEKYGLLGTVCLTTFETRPASQRYAHAMRILVLIVALSMSASAASVVCATSPIRNAVFPALKPQPSWDMVAADIVADEKKYENRWWDDVTPGGHTWNGDYLNSKLGKIYNIATLKMENGVPLVLMNGNYTFHPLAVAQHALKMHSLWIDSKKEEDKAAFLHAADLLIQTQDKRGAFVYQFPFREARNFVEYQPGWVSGILQGQALSVMARAYDVTHDIKYLNSGDLAYQFLNTPITEGGTRSDLGDIDPSLKRYLFWEEYPPIAPASQSHVLNGFMFAILGVYDWSHTPGAARATEAARLFRCGVTTLKAALPLYDLGHGVDAYDLGHLQPNATSPLPGEPLLGHGYQAVHIYLLLALESIVKDGVFHKEAEKLAAGAGKHGLSPLTNP
jgi:hypothetical protein